LSTEPLNEPRIARLLRRERVIVLAAIAAVGAVAWGYIVLLARAMEMGGMDMSGYRALPMLEAAMVPAEQPWGADEAILVFIMWAVMMIGMMLPSAAPMILLYARVGRQSAEKGHPLASATWFATGYLLMWCAFALAATAGQWALDRSLFLSPMMATTSRAFGAFVLIAAGFYQWSPLKDACLKQCQSPWLFIQNNGGFRGGAKGALMLGARHGAYCIGCCWALMALLFVLGVMNVVWIALLAILVLAEKTAVRGYLLSRASGAALIGVGLWFLI
jgi:predicted metal-binding membrane protein